MIKTNSILFSLLLMLSAINDSSQKKRVTKKTKNARILIFMLFLSYTGIAQNGTTDTSSGTHEAAINYGAQRDIIDMAGNALHKTKGNRTGDTDKVIPSKLRIAGPLPSLTYSLSTGFSVLIVANASFYTNSEANASSIYSGIVYTQYKQAIVPLQTNIWTRNNKYDIIFDWRYLYYPSYDYGLGGFTTSSDGYLIDYSTIKLHQALLRQVAPDIYTGIGYSLDYYWNIKDATPGSNTTDFQNYGFSKTEFASGFTLNFLYDTRRNSINPEKGNFVNVVYRPNMTIFGSTDNWQSLVADIRKYIKLSANSQNVLAFWSYEWFTLAGKTPYLMLPSTGGDPNYNSGRGYVVGRFRGANMAYLESEYRFGILNNGFLGGVVFANAQSFTEQSTNRFQTIIPACGAGLRIKFNKFSRTNTAIDYGYGIKGSRGIFMNLGEVF